jgi:hypothetical protein
MSGKDPKETSDAVRKSTRLNTSSAGPSDIDIMRVERESIRQEVRESIREVVRALSDQNSALADQLSNISAGQKNLSAELNSQKKVLKSLQDNAVIVDGRLNDMDSAMQNAERRASNESESNAGQESGTQMDPRGRKKSTVAPKTVQTKNKHRSPRNPPDSEPSSSSSDDEHEDRHRPTGSRRIGRSNSSDKSSSDEEKIPTSKSSKYPGLKETKVKRKVFREVLSYRTYRLKNKEQEYSDKVSGRLHSYYKKVQINIRETRKFDGGDPPAILRFLTSFKTGCDQNRISEGAAMRLVQYFLEGEAETSYQVFLDNPDQSISYAHAIDYLLTTYADENTLAEEYQKINRMKQRPGESEREFASRIYAQTSRLGSLFGDEDRTAIFLAGINPKVQASYQSNPGPDFRFRSVVTQCYHAAKSLSTESTPSLEYPVKRILRARDASRTSQALLVSQEQSPVKTIPTYPYNRAAGKSPYSRPVTPYTPGRPFDCHLCGTLGHSWKVCPLLSPELQEKAKQQDLLRIQKSATSMNLTAPNASPGIEAYTIEADNSEAQVAAGNADGVSDDEVINDSEN